MTDEQRKSVVFMAIPIMYTFVYNYNYVFP